MSGPVFSGTDEYLRRKAENAARRKGRFEMGLNKETGEVTEATWAEDDAANAERAADLRMLDDTAAERAGRPHLEVNTTCRSCGTALIVEIDQPCCEDCGK
jgi:hypothetical protein